MKRSASYCAAVVVGTRTLIRAVIPKTAPRVAIPRRRRLSPARFELHRDVDVTGKSGTGVVARGWRLPLRAGAVMVWRHPYWTVVYFPRVDWVEKIHGHEGLTRVVWR